MKVEFPVWVRPCSRCLSLSPSQEHDTALKYKSDVFMITSECSVISTENMALVYSSNQPMCLKGCL